MENNDAPEKDVLARLEQENRELREQVKQQGRANLKIEAESNGCFVIVGAVVVSIIVGLIVFGLLYQYPPWIKAKSQYQHVLYWSSWVKDYKTEFVGFDHVGSAAKKHVDKPVALASGDLYNVTEYRIWWPLLWIEWAIVFGLIAGGYFYANRTRLNEVTRKKLAKSSHTEDATG